MTKSYYAIIPANVRYDKDLPPNAKLLYGEITALCNEKGYCWAENKYFADLYEVSKTSISKWIKALCDKGYIRSSLVYKEGSKEIDKRYITIVNDPVEEKLNTPLTKVKDPIEEKLKDNNTLNNKNNNTLNNKSKEESSGAKAKKNSFDAIIKDYAKEDERLIELLGEWLKVRKAKRAAMTDYAIQLNLNKLDALAKESGLTVHDYLEQVIQRGWAAFYAINNYGGNKNSGADRVTINGKEYEKRNGKYYIPGGSGVAVDPYKARTEANDEFADLPF